MANHQKAALARFRQQHGRATDPVGERIAAASHEAYALVRQVANSLPKSPRRNDLFGPGADELDDLEHIVTAAQSLGYIANYERTTHRPTYLSCAQQPLRRLVQRFSDERRQGWLSAGCEERIRALADAVDSIAADLPKTEVADG